MREEAYDLNEIHLVGAEILAEEGPSVNAEEGALPTGDLVPLAEREKPPVSLLPVSLELLYGIKMHSTSI